MRVLVTTTGYLGHLLPVAPFARACARAGHEVCVVGPRPAGPLVRRLGLAFCGYGDPAPEEVGTILAAAAELGPEEGHALMVTEAFGRVVTRTVLRDALQMVGAWRPDIVVRESQEYAGYLAAERHGIPHIRAALGLASIEHQTLALVAQPMRELRAELELPPDPDGERLAGTHSLTLAPAMLEQPSPPLPLQHERLRLETTHRFRNPSRRPRSLPDQWPGNTQPLVYVTFGSVAGRLSYFPRLYRRVCEALADVPVRVLDTVGSDSDPAQLGRLPDNAHAERWVAQERVMPHAAAVVCHASYGSLLGALARGVPLVLTPLFAGDQWHNARRVAQIGAGITLEGSRRTMLEHPGDEVLAALPGALTRILDDARYGAAARRVAAAMDALPPVDRVADVLRALTSGSAHSLDGQPADATAAHRRKTRRDHR